MALGLSSTKFTASYLGSTNFVARRYQWDTGKSYFLPKTIYRTISIWIPSYLFLHCQGASCDQVSQSTSMQWRRNFETCSVTMVSGGCHQLLAVAATVTEIAMGPGKCHRQPRLGFRNKLVGGGASLLPPGNHGGFISHEWTSLSVPQLCTSWVEMTPKL